MSDIDLETLRQSWQSMRIELDHVKEKNHDLTQRIINNQVRSVLDYVKRPYRVMTVIALLYIFFMPILCIREFQMGIVPTVLSTLFFLLAFIMDGSVLLKISKIQPTTMTVRDMLISITNLEIYRSRIRVLGYAMAAPMLALLLYYMWSVNQYAFYGGCVGGFIGLIIGIRLDIKISREMRELRRSLAEELAED